ncbi:MAG: DinB family protein [Gemmatimonadota bacterium]
MDRAGRAGIVARLKANADVFRALLVDVTDEQARWKPEPGKWSLLEVASHLADEERDDFRRRLDLTLHHPGTPWPPIDPEGWSVERRYNERELGRVLEDLLSERRESIRGLQELVGSEGPGKSGAPVEPDWDAAYDHPKLGPVTAGDLLTSWLAHDFIHIRQMTRLHREYLVAVLSAHSPDYAGKW